MAISGNVPEHLVVGAKTGFLTALNTVEMPWQRIAGTINMDARSVEVVDLGAAPMPVEDRGGGPLQDFIEKSLEVKAKSWDIKVGISYNAVKDDQTASLERKVRSAAENFQRHMNNLVFKAVDGGDGSTYGLCYDGQYFFDNDHTDKGASYSTAQDNLFALTLSLDNFRTNLQLARLFKDDQGEYTEHNYDLLVVPPALEYEAAQICGNPRAYDTANQENNPYSGRFNYIVSAQLATTAWACFASSQPEKPLYLAIREQPNMQDSWFDPDGPDGGMYYFKFFARYNVMFGDWRLGFLGNS